MMLKAKNAKMDHHGSFQNKNKTESKAREIEREREKSLIEIEMKSGMKVSSIFGHLQQ